MKTELVFPIFTFTMKTRMAWLFFTMETGVMRGHFTMKSGRASNIFPWKTRMVGVTFTILFTMGKPGLGEAFTMLFTMESWKPGGIFAISGPGLKG